MNLNDFVVLPNNKAKSLKLNARKLQELQMETVTLAEERNEMEEKLLQLKESMSKEKIERGHSGGFKWKSGLCGNNVANSTVSKESRLQKLSAGKLKIRMLKNEPLKTAPQPLPPTKTSTTGLQTTRKTRLKGTVCGQCEVRTAGLMCAECAENYCIGCFAKFHHRGALKLHKMVPIKTDLHTHVSTPDVISSFQKQIDTSLYPCTFANPSPSLDFKPHAQPHQTFTFRQRDQSPKRGTEDLTQVLFDNQHKEEMLEINGEGRKKEKPSTSLLEGWYSEEESTKSFQDALRQWRGENTEPTKEGGRDNHETMWIPIQPVAVSVIATQVDLPPEKGAEGQAGRTPFMVEFKENTLTYMDRLILKKHRRTPVESYHSSHGIPGGLKLLSNTHSEEPENKLKAQEDFHHYCESLFAVSTSMSGTDPPINSPESCLVIEVLDETEEDKNGCYCDVQIPKDNNIVPLVQQKSSNDRKLDPQTTSTRAMPSKNKPLACSTAETSRTSKSSIKTPTSKSQKTNFSPTAHKSNADNGSLHVLSSCSLTQLQTETQEFSPSCSYNFFSLLKGLDSSLLQQQQPQSSQSIHVSSIKPSQPPVTLVLPAQNHNSLCVPEYVLTANQVQGSVSLASPRPNPKPKPLTPSDKISRYPSDSTYEDCMSCASIPVNAECIPSDEINVIQNSPSVFDSEDEISSDCLVLASNEEISSDEEPQIFRHITRGRSRGEEQGNPAISHLGDSFVPADAERVEDFQTDEPEQLSEPSLVLHSQRAGSGSELSCDLHEFTPLGLDRNSGRSETPGHTQSDLQHTCQTSLPDSNRKDLFPAFRPLSRAAQEILEICSVDQTGCEDPDLDTDTAANTLHSLEQELRLLANDIGENSSVFGTGSSESQALRGNQTFSWGRVGKEEKEEKESAQKDMQSVLLLS